MRKLTKSKTFRLILQTIFAPYAAIYYFIVLVVLEKKIKPNIFYDAEYDTWFTDYERQREEDMAQWTDGYQTSHGRPEKKLPKYKMTPHKFE